MPAKSRHGKSKRTTRSKRKGMRAAVVVQTQPPAVSPVAEAGTPAVKTPAGASRRAVVPAVGYPYLLGDIRRIGLLAALTLVLLAVLYFILPSSP